MSIPSKYYHIGTNQGYAASFTPSLYNVMGKPQSHLFILVMFIDNEQCPRPSEAKPGKVKAKPKPSPML